MSRSLLIAHDRSYQRRILRSALVRCGFDVAQAADSASALRYVCENRPDALIVDAEFQGMCAQELCEEIIRRTGDARPLICVVTESVDDKLTAWWRELPDTILVERPLSVRALSHKIERHFEESAEES